jgi:hypothetical protein
MPGPNPERMPLGLADGRRNRHSLPPRARGLTSVRPLPQRRRQRECGSGIAEPGPESPSWGQFSGKTWRFDTPNLQICEAKKRNATLGELVFGVERFAQRRHA